jgi:hypothetical protein
LILEIINTVIKSLPVTILNGLLNAIAIYFEAVTAGSSGSPTVEIPHVSLTFISIRPSETGKPSKYLKIQFLPLSKHTNSLPQRPTS